MAIEAPPGPAAVATRRPGVVGTGRAAVALLTRLPVRPDDAATSGAAAFPLVGVIVGVIGAVPLAIGAIGEPVLAGILAVAAMTVLTGALHLDGLADTADALLAPDPTTAERARKDPAVGPGGAVALILVLGIEVAALASLVTAGPVWAGIALIVAAVVGRTLPVVTIAIAPSRVEAGGFGGWFAARVGRSDTVIAVVTAAIVTAGLAIATGSPAIAIGGVAGAVAGLVIAAAIVHGRRQLDGDGMGAIIELTVAATLVATAIAR